MKHEWAAKTKPPSDVCPERFCFHWADAGDRVTGAGVEYVTLDDAINDAAPVCDSRCACSFGQCIRDTSTTSNTDWYEPNERALQRAELPWFYFIASIKKLGKQFHLRYTYESTALWGDHDGLK